jgi:peptidoglycan/xylan/chitin deacetylase (PgdA/CDA1 family)
MPLETIGALLLRSAVWRGPREGRRIALTFDDGPSPSTPALLDLLDRHGAKATFFVCGVNVRRHPAVLRETAARGHELGNHSDTHPNLFWMSNAAREPEIRRAQDSVGEAAGVAPRWFRPPYGLHGPGLTALLRRLSLQSVMWTTIARDWIDPAERISRRLAGGAQPGAILCLHDGRALSPEPDIAPTLAALADVLPRLRGEGFQFVTVSELVWTPSPSA